MNRRIFKFGTVIVGGGPAGTAVLLAACRAGQLEQILNAGLAIVEATNTIGAGRIGNYAINSDSTANTFVDCLRNNPYEELTALLEHPLTQEIIALGDNGAPLSSVGQLSRLVGDALQHIILRHPSCAIYTGYTAKSAQQCGNGKWQVRIAGGQTRPLDLITQNVVMATGAYQPNARLQTETVGGANIHYKYSKKLIHSDAILQHGGLEYLADRLKGRAAPRVAIIGGSTSAVAVAHSLLTRMSPTLFEEKSVSILHRRDFNIYYSSPEAALAEGYTNFTQRDICPISGRVFRFAGLRLDSRELIMRARGIAERPPEPRLHLHQLKNEDPTAIQIMDRADVIVAAMGYRPNALTVLNKFGQAIKLFARTGYNATLVDDKCRVLDEYHRPIDGLFGIGLAAGFVPRGALGGEPSFSGQANGLWLWQTAVGALIVDSILMRATLMPAPQALPVQRNPPAAHPFPVAANDLQIHHLLMNAEQSDNKKLEAR